MADKGHQGARRSLTVAFSILACVLALLSSLAMWLRALVLDTDAYVRAIGPVLDDGAVRDALADDIVSALYRNVDVTALLRESLPDKAASFAPTLAASIRETSVRLASTALGTPAVRNAWKEANRLAHRQVVHVLEGKGEIVTTKNGEVAVELGPLARQVVDALDDAGIHVFDSVDISDVNERFVLFRSTDLLHAQQATRVLDGLGTWLPVATVVVIAGALVASVHRRRTVAHLAIAIATAMLVIIVGAAVGRAYYLDAVGGTVSRTVAAAPFDALVRPLRTGVRWAFTLALLVWAGATFSASRELLAREEALRRRISATVRQVRRPLALGVLVVAGVVLVAWDRPRPITVAAILASAGLAELAIAFAARA